MTKSSSVSAVDRLVSVLNSFSQQRPAWSLAELSTHLELPKSTLHRFLVSLETHDILRRNPDSKLWEPGYRLLYWGELAEQSTGLIQVTRPLMEELAKATGEMIVLTVYANHEVVCLARIEARHPVRLQLEVGARRPAHAGASSKILTAFLPEEEVQAIIRERGLPRLCTSTITEPELLAAELAQIRAQGYAQSIEETDSGAWGIATPVFKRGQVVAGSVGVAGPIQRYSDDLAQRYVALCREACHRASLQLGAQPGTPTAPPMGAAALTATC
ncbi:IclR family transcriptional regulator [Chloroflexota bacterium]